MSRRLTVTLTIDVSATEFEQRGQEPHLSAQYREKKMTSSGGDDNTGQNSDNDTAATSQRQVFLKDGFVCLRQALPVESLQVWQDVFAQLWSFLFQRLYEYGHTAFAKDSRLDEENGKKKRVYSLRLGIKHGFREVVMRSLGRYELSLLHHDWFWHEKGGSFLLEQLKEQLRDIVPPLLGKSSSWENVKIANLSFVVSTPSATTQAWHADGGHVNLQQHEPCHCFNVFIPLQDMPCIDWGPTELRPASHYYTRNLAPMLLAAKCRKELRPTVAPLLQQGDILAFDYRILHRGLANTTEQHNRIVLVLTVAEPWFEDRLNFPTKSLYPGSSAEDDDKLEE